MDREGTITLLSVILTDTPQLNGAACVGRYQLYDEIPGRGQSDQRRQRYQAAAGVCSLESATPSSASSSTASLLACRGTVRRLVRRS